MYTSNYAIAVSTAIDIVTTRALLTVLAIILYQIPCVIVMCVMLDVALVCLVLHV